MRRVRRAGASVGVSTVPEVESAVAGESLADITERLFTRFEGAVPLPTIARVVRRCRRELDIAAPGALPELLERLAHQRLQTLAASSATPPAR